MADHTVAAKNYADLPRPFPMPEKGPLVPPAPSPRKPHRPPYNSKKSFKEDTPRTKSLGSSSAPGLQSPKATEIRERTSSPEKKSGGLRRTLRSTPTERSNSSKKIATTHNNAPAAAARAATQVWSGSGPPSELRSSSEAERAGTPMWDPRTKSIVHSKAQQNRPPSDSTYLRMPSASDPSGRPTVSMSISSDDLPRSRKNPSPYPDHPRRNIYAQPTFAHSDEGFEAASTKAPMPPLHRSQRPSGHAPKSQQEPAVVAPIQPSSISYMKEFPNHPPAGLQVPADVLLKRSEPKAGSHKAAQASSSSPVTRKPANKKAIGVVSAMEERRKLDGNQIRLRSPKRSDPAYPSGNAAAASLDASTRQTPRLRSEEKPMLEHISTSPTIDDDVPSTPTEDQEWKAKVQRIMKELPKGVDEAAAKQIFNEIVIKGDEVHWDDVAGLEIAKSALKETVVYPFLRPDLFMGLREPARGMLLFGPPGTGKTMLARAVATESKSVFFAISASSLTSKFLGESEKLVRALFALARALAPSIIFVDEIDSLLGSRGGSSEHEATRRVKTEFFIQWSDLQRAAAGREVTEGDATRVLVLAATNLPWAIDEAARRRFVRRQYIPLPEPEVRAQQLRTLLAAQRHTLSDADLADLVARTANFSGSDITALAKDAAMGPLRSLGEKLLHMRPEDIRGIDARDFAASLGNIRPSVSQQGLKQFEDWAREFGERGG